MSGKRSINLYHKQGIGEVEIRVRDGKQHGGLKGIVRSITLASTANGNMFMVRRCNKET